MARSFDGVVETTVPFAPVTKANSLPQRGLPIFFDALTNEPYGFDPWDLKREGRVSSTVLGVLAEKGHGKTSTNMLFAWRFGRRQIANRMARIGLDDHRTNNGVPEYQRLCNIFGVQEITLRKHELNLLDMELGFTFGEQFEILKETLEFALRRDLNIPEGEALRYGLKKVRKYYPTNAELGLLAEGLRRITLDEAEEYRTELATELSSRHRSEDAFLDMMSKGKAGSTKGLLNAANNMASTIEMLLDGPFGKLFGGRQSLASALQARLVALDYNGLTPEATTLVQSLLWRIKTSAINRNDHRYFTDIEIHDENYSMWSNLIYARAMSKYMKRIRSTSTLLVLGTHRIADYYTVSSKGSEQYELATNMIGDIDMWLLGGMEPRTADETAQYLHLSKQERNYLMRLNSPDMVGNWLLKIGNEPTIRVKTRLTDLERALSDSDAANDEIAVSGKAEGGIPSWHQQEAPIHNRTSSPSRSASASW